MNLKEFGTEHNKVIVLLHGGGLSWWNFKDAAEYLEHNYHVVLPILDGHGGSDREFSSIEDNAAEIIAYIDEHLGGRVLMIGGISLGAQILVEMLSQRSDICEYAVIESALAVPMRLTHTLVKPMLSASCALVKKPWFSRLQFKSLGLNDSLYDFYYTDTCRISKNSMIAFLSANSDYNLKPMLSSTQTKAYIFVGSKEYRKMKLSAKKLHRLIPNSRLEILKGMAHGEFSANHGSDYVQKITSILST